MLLSIPRAARRLTPLLLVLLSGACSNGSASSTQTGTTGPPGGTGNPPPPVETKVLFLGNSYTATNALPAVLGLLADERGRLLTKSAYAPGGNTLGAPQASAHSTNPTSLAMIAADTWDWVILQEQSTTPTIPFRLENYMKPGAASLDASIKANDASTRTLLFQTWGRRDGGQFCGSGDCSPVFADFDQMQDSLTTAYADVGQLIGAQVAPIGEAWRRMRAQDPTLPLHQFDGSHPTHEGTYLSACVFYAVLFDESPVGISYTNTITSADAAVLQDVAAHAVFGPTCGVSEYSAGAGPANTLSLAAIGDAQPGSTLDIAPTQVPETGWWCLSSLAPASDPGFGGVVLVDLSQPLFPSEFHTGVDGLTLDIPSDPILAGFDMYFQALAPDATQPGGYSLSNGIRVEVCP